jgi:fumarate reductase flavoprotein subunit
MRIALFGVMVAVAVGLSCGAWAAGDGPLGNKHATAGIDCVGCHQERPPRTLVPTGVCTACHGAYAVLAGKTEKKHPNPHASHQGELPCESCHHAHGPSADHCAQCHDFGFTVP